LVKHGRSDSVELPVIEEELPSPSRTDAPDAGLSAAHTAESEICLLCFYQINT